MPTPEQRRLWIARIAALPDQLDALVRDLTPDQLDAAPTPDAWSPRQIVHHLPDSHMNAFIRLRLALTEDSPTIRPYDQDAFARLPDTRDLPVDVSLRLLRALHERWVYLLEQLDEAQWTRTYLHPVDGVFTIESQTESYAEHGEAHLRQITAALAGRVGWNRKSVL